MRAPRKRGPFLTAGICSASQNREFVNALRAYLISASDCHRERLRQLISAGANAVCLPIVTTRTGLQSAADEANRLGLPVFGWIALAGGSSAGGLRRLVEAYPTLDGYFVSGLPSGSAENLTGYQLIPILTAESAATHARGIRVAAPLSVLNLLHMRRSETIAIITGTSESEIKSGIERAESSGAAGIVIAMTQPDSVHADVD